MTKVADSREMGTDRPALDEIEVTPEMIEAESSAYFGVDRYAGDPPIDDETLLVVFRAMTGAKR